MTGEQPESFDAWIGRREDSVDRITPAPIRLLRATLDDAEPSALPDVLPPLWHWLYFLPGERQSNIGIDGHPRRGGFLPPVALPRRMWAGGRLTFHKPLLVGAEVTRTSTICGVKEKTGRSGRLVFVTVRHDLDAGEGIAISEEQDLVYREPAAGTLPEPVAAPAPAVAWLEDVNPDPVLLFRYSALTMNGHRIHYDRPYALGEESYPGLVVHGPLQATLLIQLAARNLDVPITGFEFRGQQPAFEGVRLHVCGEPTESGAEVWTQQGADKNMVATVRTGAVA